MQAHVLWKGQMSLEDLLNLLLSVCYDVCFYNSREAHVSKKKLLCGARYLARSSVKCQKPYCLMTVVTDELIHIQSHVYVFWKVYTLSKISILILLSYNFLPSPILPVPDSTQIVPLNGLSFPHTIFMVMLSSPSVLC